MLKSNPKLKYNGLTVVMSNPSRHDTARLLSANGGTLFNNWCLQPEFNIMQCEVRLMNDPSPWREGTKCILLLGEQAMHKFVPSTSGNTLNEMRGSPLYVDNIPAMASYLPQEAIDRKGYEQQYNELSGDFEGGESSSDEDDEGDVKRFSNTKRKNYPFWLRADVRKCKKLLSAGDNRWPIETEPRYHLFPDADKVIKILLETKNSYVDFDIETDFEDANLLCFSFTVDGTDIYSVPILNYNYQWAYKSVPTILRALAICCMDNIMVAHNGHSFDFFVLAYKYQIAIGKAYDTLIAQHRIFPDIEKSLGHCVSYWTYQKFHKDIDSEGYRTHDHMMQKLLYCAKDVFTMRLVRLAQMKYATKIPGLLDSINCGNNSIRPYLIATMQGMTYFESERAATMKENDRLMTQYLRMINILIGEAGMIEIRSAVKNAKGGFPGSNPQCVKYFHDMLGYAVVGRSKEEDKNGFRKPSLGKVAMFKLALKHDNPVIRLVLMYRTLKKESGSLKFIPWRSDDGKIINRDTYRPEKDGGQYAFNLG